MYFALLITLAAVVFRLSTAFFGNGSDWIPNFTPLAAIALCGACYLPRRLAFIIPLGALFVSDLILNAHFGVAMVNWEMAVRYAALATIAWLGVTIATRSFSSGRSPALPLFGGSLLGSAIFHLATNSVCWISSPGYAKTFNGWVQSWTIGLPEFQPPAWVFFRNSAVSDLLFTGLFILCMALTAKKTTLKQTVVSLAPTSSSKGTR